MCPPESLASYLGATDCQIGPQFPFTQSSAFSPSRLDPLKFPGSWHSSTHDQRNKTRRCHVFRLSLREFPTKHHQIPDPQLTMRCKQPWVASQPPTMSVVSPVAKQPKLLYHKRWRLSVIHAKHAALLLEYWVS